MLGARSIGGQIRPPVTVRDRFILTVEFGAPATITNSLAPVLAKCRPIADSARLSGLPDSLNADEKRALALTRSQIQRSWTTINNAAPTAQEEISVIHLMHVLQLDLRVDGAQYVCAKDGSLGIIMLLDLS